VTDSTITNAGLAARARAIAARAPRGSQDRKAYGCAAVALANTSTRGAARKVLARECPDFVKAAALAALEQVTTTELETAQ
jgi:hypothetical protein